MSGKPELELGALALDDLSPEQREGVERSLRTDPELARLWSQANEALGRFAEGLTAVAPPPAVWQRLQDSLDSDPQRPLDTVAAPLTARIAHLLDLTVEQTRALLSQLPQPWRWVAALGPGIELFHLTPGPSLSGAACGFVRVPAGAPFPEHRHLGDELVLVLQGAFATETGELISAGREHRMPAGSAHSFTARPGPALVYLAVVREGIEIAGQRVLASDPRL